MNIEQLTFRNNLAVELVTALLTKTLDYESSALVNHAFELADLTCARMKADSDKLIKELNAKAANARAVQQAEFNALIGSMKPGKIEVHHQACGANQINQAETQHPLRRAEDKVEVHEVSVEQAIDMIASLFHAAKH